ncbi:Gfo/Idh/MocA family protein [Streptomyces griseiscabiei]|uniref:Gfo/Idh/MocA family oxidoreductase n=1 Tax=Streptomyces griseiscabiei TaxID=2993540 RepID=A0ABU4LGM3_9ACTN|nr:Gfo/Idh/MocA family oxidoreductase [Streptomyces griseiscabiei]MBZ3900428.1 Gfo/Idh/MocA family oxidoreductase [Streptomyces griseiscabiei]MDX2914596.1 Gfo/Idh/MocA family oxidoreductase [Streptomyces griseiscabiei]
MPSSRPPYRVAIIGTGGIAHAHAEALGELSERARLVAVADLDPNRAAEFADRFRVPQVFSDPTALLESGEPLDLVHICTPPRTHAPLAAQVMRAGATALVEKPTALSLREMDELAEVQEQTGSRVLTVFQHRYGATAVRLRRLVESGALGRPHVATCETLWYRPDEYFEVPWRGCWDAEGGGPTMGHGIHQFDLMVSVLGPWSVITALADRRARPTDTEDVSVAAVRFADGALATVVNSLLSPRETSRLRFDFEHATVELEHLYGYREEHWRFTPASGHEELAALWNDGAGPDLISGHRLQIEAVFDAWEAGREPGVSLVDARRTLEFAAATYASAFRGVPVTAGELAGDDPFTLSMDGGAVPWEPVKETLV